MPTFICQKLRDTCIEQNAGSQDGQEACEKDIGSKCATENPPAPEDVEEGDGGDDETTSTSTSATQSPTQSSNNEETVSTTESDGFAAPTAAPKAVGALAALGLVAALI